MIAIASTVRPPTTQTTILLFDGAESPFLTIVIFVWFFVFWKCR